MIRVVNIRNLHSSVLNPPDYIDAAHSTQQW